MVGTVRTLRALLLSLSAAAVAVAVAISIALSFSLSFCGVSAQQGVAITLQPDFAPSAWRYVAQTVPTLQAVVNPLMRRGFSPIHDASFDALAALRTDYTRFQGWYPYPKLVVAELDAPSGTALCRNVGVGYNLTLSCTDPDGTIASIDYASFGELSGQCQTYRKGSCSSANATAVVEKLCLGQRECTVPADPALFGQPCPASPADVRLAVQVQCDPPRNHTYWDFSGLSPLVEDVMQATSDRSIIINLCTWPAWLFNLTGQKPHYYPDDPNEADFHYLQGSVPLDHTGDAVGEYYARVASYYTQGGMTDEYGVFHASPYTFEWPMWEVFNEIDSRMDIAVYTRIYDAVQRHVRACCDPQRKMEFVGLALAGRREQGFNMTLFTYFLNHSNHEPDATLDWISYHFYGHPDDRVNISTWQQIYDSTDIFIQHMLLIEAVRVELSPETRTTLDEVGTILPDDNNATAPMFPNVYWSAASAGFAYLYARVLPYGIEVVGSSQLLGFPELPDLHLSPQYPSVSMLNWTTGAGTPRYWVVQLLLDHFAPGDPVVAMNVTVVGGGGGGGGGGIPLPAEDVLRPVYAVAFAAQPAERVKANAARALESSLSSNRLLLVNTQDETFEVVLPDGLVTAQTRAYTVDELSGESPARPVEIVNGTSLTLQRFAVCVVVFAEDVQEEVVVVVE